MKNIGRFLAGAFLILAGCPLSAFEAGGQIVASGGASGNGGGRPLAWLFAHQNSSVRLVGWFDLPFVDDAAFGLAGQGSLKYSQENSADAHPVINLIADIDLLRYYYTNVDEKGGFSLSVGRFNVADKTTTIINQKVDGFHFGYNASKIQFGAYIGYTGLLNSKNTLIINSTGKNYWSDLSSTSLYDIYEENVKSVPHKDFSSFLKDVHWNTFRENLGEQAFTWADPYVLSSINIGFPYLFANQTPYIEASLAVSTEGPSKIQDEFDRFYLTGGCYGPFIFSSLVYNFSTTFATSGDPSSNRSAFNGVSNLSKLDFTYFTGFYSLALSANLVYASGDNGIYDPFHGFTSTPISYMRYSPEHSSAVKYGISASFKPVKEFLVTLGADQLFSYEEDVVRYQGWQCYTEMKLQCTSDFQFQVKAYRFFGEDTTYDNTGASVMGIFSF